MANTDTLFDKLTEKDENDDRKYHNLRVNLLIKFLILFSTIVIISLFFNYHLEETNYDYNRYSYTAGYIWNEDPIIAEFDFAINRPLAEYKKETNEASLTTERIFLYDKAAYTKVTANIDNYLRPEYFRSDSTLFSYDSKQLIDTLNPEQKSQALNLIKKYIRKFAKEVYAKGVINIPISEIDLDIVLAETEVGDRALIKKSTLYDEERFENAYPVFIITNVPRRYAAVANEMAQHIFIPNMKFSSSLTASREEELRNAVPRTKGIVRKGEKLIEKGATVTESDIEKIHSYQNMRFLLSEDSFSVSNYLGSVGHVALLLALFFIYLYQMRKKLFYNNFYVGLICVSFIIIGLLSWLSIEIGVDLPIEYLIFLPAASMLAAIIFDSRTAFYLTVSMALLVAGVRGNDYTMGLVMLITGSVAAYTVRDIQNRTQMYQSIFFIFITFFVCIVVFALEWSEGTMHWLLKSGVSLLNAVLSPLITFGILYLLDKYSPITTDLKLEEYDDLNHPLLVKMNEVAPGTYQHSIGVASLAERCAAAIKANQLYCKVTSLYHDIGKLERPEYFVENQIDINNKHDKIPPRKSAQIIIEHVTHGATLAREYKLPENIIDIILTHHGTTMVGHFYAKEVEKKGIENVDKKHFTYPGPIPKSKEAVIIMICDAAEAMSRISPKGRKELETMVEGIILNKIKEKQFMNSDITTRELHKIKDTIVKNLVAISHKRVEYKTTDRSTSTTEQRKK